MVFRRRYLGYDRPRPPWIGTRPPAGELFTVTATDHVLLGDLRTSLLDRLLVDRVVMPDVPVRGEEHQQREGVLLSDTVAAQAIRQLLLGDAVLLRDARVSLLGRSLLDGLVLRDDRTSLLERLLGDHVLLRDAVTAEHLGAAPTPTPTFVIPGRRVLVGGR
jgi:hypothetical protein